MLILCCELHVLPNRKQVRAMQIILPCVFGAVSNECIISLMSLMAHRFHGACK
jgi:hypothetical protein